MSPTVRFAPSPTGYLHVGNMRTALINWLFAHRQGGKFILRVDDTDAERSRPEYELAIEEDLRWLGLEWDAKARQSERFGRYEAAKQTLLANGWLYPCYDTAEELEIRRKMQLSRGLPPVYDRAALRLTDAEKEKYKAEGRSPHFRFRLEEKDIAWDDLIRGPAHFHGKHLSDPVLIREDGVPLYTLASVVDDGEMDVTHVIRGEDHVSNTAVQIQLYEALGFAVPQFAHMSLLKTKVGEISKRLGGFDIRSLRNAGILPMAVNSYLAKIGTSDPVQPFATLEALVASFDIQKLGRAPAIYDAGEIEKLNEKLIHQLPYADIRAFYPEIGEDFWLSVRGNLKRVAEVRDWWEIVHGDIASPPAPEDKEFLKEALALLPPEPWSEQTWSAWTKALSEKTGRKGKALFMPLRKALTGREHGPEMARLLVLMDREKILKRLHL